MSSAGIVQSTREGHSIDISLRDVSISTRRGGFVVEGINADSSRDGDAKTPATVFSNAPVSGTFNDRLAY